MPTLRTRRWYSARPCRRPASSGPGARFRGWARRSGPCGGPAGHADTPAVAAEEFPVGKTRGPGDHLHPSGDLRLRQPEHLHPTANVRRPDGVQCPHGGGGDGHHGALGLGVGLGADCGDAAAAVVPAHNVVPQVRAAASERLKPASDSTATKATSNLARSAACSTVSKPRPRLRGWTAVSRITASTSAVRAPDWRWGFESRRPHPFKEARTAGSRQGEIPASPTRGLSRWSWWRAAW